MTVVVAMAYGPLYYIGYENCIPSDSLALSTFSIVLGMNSGNYTHTFSQSPKKVIQKLLFPLTYYFKRGL